MNLKSIFNFLTAAMLTIGIFSCKKTSNPIEIGDPGTPDFRNAFFPMAVGNSWTYTDSLFTATDTTTTTYTISIVGYRTDSTGNWWEFQSDNPSVAVFYRYLTQRNDSVYSLQYNFQYPVYSLEYIPPPSSDTTYFYALLGGDVRLRKSVLPRNTIYSTPAGGFDSCSVYHFEIAELQVWEVLRPKIGIVGRDIQFASFYNHGGWYRKIRLIRYNLIK